MNRKFLIGVALVALIFSFPKKSQAGIILLSSGGSTVTLVIGGVLSAAGTAGSVGAISLLNSSGNGSGYESLFGFFLAVPSVALLTVDADGLLNQDEISRELSMKYSFIENDQVFEELSHLISLKAQKSLDQEIKVISLEKSEFDEILSPINKNGIENEIDLMFRDLVNF